MSFYDHLKFPLRDGQQQFADLIFAEPNNNFLFTAPTGYGKTIIAVIAMYQALKENKKIVLTTPLRALASEQTQEFSKHDFFLKKLVDVKVLIDTGDTLEKRMEEGEDYYKNGWNVLITTNERLEVIFRSESKREKILKDVKYFIFDEIHLLGSRGRGGTVETLIMALKAQIVPDAFVIGLSATLPNAEQFGNWMKASAIIIPNDKRPVKLEPHFEAPHPNAYRSNKQKINYKMKQLKSIIVKHYNDQILVFVSSRKRTEELGQILARFRSNESIAPSTYSTAEIIKEKNQLIVRNRLQKDIEKDKNFVNEKIQTFFKSKVAYHHAGLSKEERKAVEDGFRDGKIRIIIATPSLAQGVNLPCTNVVMFDLSRWNAFISGFERIEHYEIGQMTGRAGRPQYDAIGRAFFLGSNDEMAFARESITNPRNMDSQLDELLDEKILSFAVSGLANSQKEMNDLFRESFAHFQYKLNSKMVTTETQFLKDKFFLKEYGTQISPTPMGSLSSKMYLKPRTIVEVINNFYKHDKNQINPLELASVFLKNGEILSQIRISDMDDRLINEANEVFNYPQANVQLYNTAYKEWQSWDKSPEFIKLLAFLFSDEIRTKLYVPKQELYTLRKTAEGLIGRIYSVLQSKNKIKDLVTRRQVKMLQMMILNGTLDPKKAELAMVPKIGEKTIEKLNMSKIFTVEDFLKKPSHLAAKILRKKAQSIELMKKGAIKTFPEYKKHYKPRLNI